MPTFNDLLLSADFLKSAGPESPNQQQLEQDFGKLAYAFLRDRAPQLVNYLLGFEIVDQEEDGSKAIGIFGFKINDSYYYVPVFFVNNQIKGMDLLFNKKHNTFVPLQESWINYILNKQSISLGGTTPNNQEVRKDFENPNFWFLRSPYTAHKMASDKTAASAVNVAQDGFETWNSMQASTKEAMDKDAEFQQAFAASIWRMQGNKTFDFLKTAASKLVPFLENVGGPQSVEVIANSFSNCKYANAALTFYPDIESLIVREFNETLAPKKAEEKLKIITEIYDGPAMVASQDQKRIVRDGFSIKDVRDASEKSEVFPTDYSKRFSTPSEPGKYNLLLSNGGTVEAWLFMPSKPDARYMLAYEPSKKFAATADPSMMIVRDQKIDSDKTPYDSAIELDKMEVGKHYFLINNRLNTSGIFKVRTIRAANDIRTELCVNFEHTPRNLTRKDNTWEDVHAGFRDRYDDQIDTIQLADFNSDKLRNNANKLIVPENWKAVEVVYDPYGTEDEAAYKAFKPGTSLDLDEALFKQSVHNLAVENPDRHGRTYYFKLDDFVEGPFGYKTAAWRLAKDYGIDASDAFEMLSDADKNIKARRLVKFAQGVGVSMPRPIMQQFGSDPFTGAQIQEPDEQQITGQFTGVPPLRNPMVPGFNIGGQTETEVARGGGETTGTTLQDDVINLANQAAQSGQKTIFDHSTILGLAKIYDVSNIIDMYLPEMFKALDRLGRILFLYYWKNDEFVDRYGVEDISNMEDLIRSVFKSYGDLILKLKQKSISTNVDNLI